MTFKQAKILKAFENLAIGFANLAKDMRKNDSIYDESYLQVVLEEVEKLRKMF